MKTELNDKLALEDVWMFDAIILLGMKDMKNNQFQQRMKYEIHLLA